MSLTDGCGYNGRVAELTPAGVPRRGASSGRRGARHRIEHLSLSGSRDLRDGGTRVV